MSLKLRNNAGDAAVTLVDGGPVGSPTITLDVRDILHVDSNHAGRRWDATADYKVGDLVTIPKQFMGGFSVVEYYVALTDSNGLDPLTSPNDWEYAKFIRYIDFKLIVRVGASGDFAELGEALSYLGHFVTTGAGKMTVIIEPNHVIDYVVNVGNSSTSKITVTTENLGGLKFGDTVTLDIGSPALALEENKIKFPDNIVASGIRFNIIGHDAYSLTAIHSGAIFYAYGVKAVNIKFTFDINHSSNLAFFRGFDSIVDSTIALTNGAMFALFYPYNAIINVAINNNRADTVPTVFVTNSNSGEFTKIIKVILGGTGGFDNIVSCSSGRTIVTDCDFTGSNGKAYSVATGGIIQLDNCQGSKSQPLGTVTADGMILGTVV